MFGFTKRHEQDWRLTRLEENDKTMFEKFDRIEEVSASALAFYFD
ncbi:hypothetical protein FCFHV36_1714 [Staphylococcus aureus]|nr:hypothetical protein FCFHV36_1714 [Staphylococcus aureus]